jgi:hypothetical protein
MIIEVKNEVENLKKRIASLEKIVAAMASLLSMETLISQEFNDKMERVFVANGATVSKK